MSLQVFVRRDAAAGGSSNMAADRELLRLVEAAPDHARVRIYSWQPACVSIGYHQRESDLDRERLDAAGFDLVRRPTGGAAILHDQEITFALAAPLPDRRSRSVLELYAPIAQAVVESLRAFGLDARCAGDGRPAFGACFASRGGHEILIGERKICGIALRRGRRAYLAHGSLLTGGRQSKLAEFLVEGSSAQILDAQSTNLRLEGLDAGRFERLGDLLASRLSDRLRAVGALETACGAA